MAGKTPRIRFERWARDYRQLKILFCTFGIHKEKQFIFYDCAAEIAAKLVSLKRSMEPSGEISVEGYGGGFNHIQGGSRVFWRTARP